MVEFSSSLWGEASVAAGAFDLVPTMAWDRSASMLPYLRRGSYCARAFLPCAGAEFFKTQAQFHIRLVPFVIFRIILHSKDMFHVSGFTFAIIRLVHRQYSDG